MTNKSSTYTFTGKFQATFDILSIWEFYPLDSIITRLKYNNQVKSVDGIRPLGTFANQVTFNSGKRDVKFFSNGIIHATGFRMIDQARELIEYVLERVHKIQGEKKACGFACDGALVSNGIVLEHDPLRDVFYYTSMLYKYDKTKGRNKFILGQDLVPCEFDDRLLVTVKNVDKVRTVVNLEGRVVGEYVYKTISKGKNLRIKGVQYLPIESTPGVRIFQMYSETNRPLGTMEFRLDETLVVPRTESDKDLTISYKAYTGIVACYDLAPVNIVSSLVLGDSGFIDRDKVYSVLVNHSEYNPCYDKNSFAGLVVVINGVKLSVFRTRTVLAAGASKQLNQEAFQVLQELHRVHNFTYEAYTLAPPDGGVGVELTIHDLFDDL